MLGLCPKISCAHTYGFIFFRFDHVFTGTRKGGSEDTCSVRVRHKAVKTLICMLELDNAVSCILHS